MLALVIDTSSAAVTAALVEVGADDVAGLAEHVTINARGHGEQLAPNIAACLTDAGAGPADLTAIVAGTGPGPYTGLRVGLVTAAVMGETLGIPTYGVCSLDGIAGRYFGSGWSLSGAQRLALPMLVVTDARRKEVYWAAYRDGVRVDGPGVCRPGDLPPGRSAVGAGALLYADELRASGMPVFEEQYPSSHALARGAQDRVRGRAPSEALTPLYLRRPDAVVPGSPKTVTP